MKMTFKRSIMAIAVGAVLVSGSALALDDTKGFVKGHANGADGTSLSGVTISIKNEGKGTTRTVTTDSSGNYRAPAMAAGTYTITATQDGAVISTREHLVVSAGSKTVHDINLDLTMEEVEVLGRVQRTASMSPVRDFVVNTDELLARVPVARDLTSVAMLAPSAHGADRTFSANNHDAPALSLGGASVAENACFINGLNTTNFRNGLGCSQVPFEFYDQITVRNGGYNAEFGRAIGGVMSATTKSGGNEFKGGANIYYQPDSLQGDTPDTYIRTNSELKNEDQTFDLWASGALIQDRLFFYALYSPNSKETSYESGGQLYNSEWNDEFWGLKLDAVIAEGHTLEYTGFDDTRVESETAFGYDQDTKTRGDKIGVTNYTRGGENHTVKYTGVMADWMTLNVQYGVNKYNRTDAGTTDNNVAIYDNRTGTLMPVGNWANLIPAVSSDKREAFRMDVDFFFGDHNVRVGMDNETNTADEFSFYSGGHYYRYELIGATSGYLGDVTNNGITITEGMEYVRDRQKLNDGSFETQTNSWYVQDEWTVNDSLTVYMGVRNESFDNMNAQKDTFISIDDQWAPRAGFSYELNNDHQGRVYGNYGRYYIPIAANTNIRMAGAEFFTADYYLLDGLNSDSTPMFDVATQFDRTVYADGEVPGTEEILDTSIEPMYQDEFIVGYDFVAFEEWDFGARLVYRDLKSTIEDVAVDAGLNAYVEENYGISDFAGGFDYYVLTNPTDAQM